MGSAALLYRERQADAPALTPIWPRPVLPAPATAAIIERQFQWSVQVVARLLDLASLPVGWDGHRGRPVSPQSATYALDVLAAVMRPGTPAPSIVPLSGGAVQLEWHRKGWDIELEIGGPGETHLYTRELRTGDEEHVELGADLDRFATALEHVRDPF